jgi:hypothetical protein
MGNAHRSNWVTLGKKDGMDKKIIYASGLVDGEGWIGIVKGRPGKRDKSPKYEARLCVVNTNCEVIAWLLKNFGGNFYVKKAYKSNHRNALVWQLSCNKLYDFLKKIHPYLIIKKKQAEIVLSYLENKTITSNKEDRVSSTELAFRSDNYEQLLQLNRRGSSPATTERDSSLIKEMRQSKLTQMTNRESESRSTLTA